MVLPPPRAITFVRMKYTVLFLLGCCLCLMGAQAQQSADYRKKGSPIPPFRLELTHNGASFTNANLKPGKPLMLMIFSPECDHCEHMVDSIKANASLFKNTELILVAEARNKEHMKKFIEKTGIKRLPLFQNIGVDQSNLIYHIYTQKILPQINFYDKRQKLVKRFDGNYPLDSVKMFIK